MPECYAVYEALVKLTNTDTADYMIFENPACWQDAYDILMDIAEHDPELHAIVIESQNLRKLAYAVHELCKLYWTLLETNLHREYA